MSSPPQEDDPMPPQQPIDFEGFESEVFSGITASRSKWIEMDNKYRRELEKGPRIPEKRGKHSRASSPLIASSPGTDDTLSSKSKSPTTSPHISPNKTRSRSNSRGSKGSGKERKSHGRGNSAGSSPGSAAAGEPLKEMPLRTTTMKRRNSQARAMKKLGIDPSQATSLAPPGHAAKPSSSSSKQTSDGKRSNGSGGSSSLGTTSSLAGSVGRSSEKALKMLGISHEEMISTLPMGKVGDENNKTSSFNFFMWAKKKDKAEDVEPPKPGLYDDEHSTPDLKLMLHGDKLPEVRAGTLKELVVRLTYDRYPDPGYVTAFLLTYHSFTTHPELARLLVERYHWAPASGMTDEDQKKLTAIRLRLVNVLKIWIVHHYDDFIHDKKAHETVMELINGDMVKDNPASAEMLKKSIRDQEREKSTPTREKQVMFNVPPPKPILPSNINADITILDIHPEEVARQLTVIEFKLFREIRPRECLNQAWNKSGREHNAPHILKMIERFNQISRWVATSIVRTDNVQMRAVLINRFIVIAEKCRALNNFNAIMEIMAGLQQSSVHRLKKTWALLPTKSAQLFKYLNQLMSRENNFKNFRTALHKENPPCIPYLGVYLTDLTFIETGNPDTVANGLINFNKRRKVSMTIQEIQQYQQTPYNLERVDFLIQFLTVGLHIETDSVLHTMSLEREPRK